MYPRNARLCCFFIVKIIHLQAKDVLDRATSRFHPPVSSAARPYAVLRRQKELGPERSEERSFVDPRRVADQVQFRSPQVVVRVAEGEEHAADHGTRVQGQSRAVSQSRANRQSEYVDGASGDGGSRTEQGVPFAGDWHRW